jgi:hypothetical protein
MYQDPDLPCGCTQEMIDTAGGFAMDENTPCACSHKLIDHEEKGNVMPCNVKECECEDFNDEPEEPDWGNGEY